MKKNFKIKKNKRKNKKLYLIILPIKIEILMINH